MMCESGTAPPEYPTTPKGHYHQIFNEAVDLYRCLKDLVLKAANKEEFSEELQVVVSVYDSNIDATTLQTQLQVFGAKVSEKITNIHYVVVYI